MKNNPYSLKKIVIELSVTDISNLKFLHHYWGTRTESLAIVNALNRVAYEIKQDLIQSGFPENTTLNEAIRLGDEKLKAIMEKRNEQHS